MKTFKQHVTEGLGAGVKTAAAVGTTVDGQSAEDSALGMHNIQDEEVLKVVNGFVGSIAEREYINPQKAVDELKEKGVIFIEDINKVPEYSILIYSAHGVSEKIVQESSDRNLQVFNATCPLVTKVHMEVARLSKKQIQPLYLLHMILMML